LLGDDPGDGGREWEALRGFSGGVAVVARCGPAAAAREGRIYFSMST
jgi:hypothetical protein